MTLEEKLRSKHQGLPGLGVDASTGPDGRKGRSIYIGHVKDFFDGIMLTEEENGYIRIKNQKNYRLPENRQFYYKKQSNFYRALTEEVKRMTTFSIYNLHGMYLRPGNINGLEIGGYDFARFGWALDLHHLIKKSVSSPDPAISKFKSWITSKTSEELKKIDGKLYLEGSEAYQTMSDGDGENDTDSSMYFKYISLNRTIIGDPSYPNPYSLTDFDESVFNVKLGNHVDEEGIDVSNIDYLNERDENQEKTNYNTKYTPDVLIPTNLSSKYREGDVLYLLDDVTNEIFAYIIVNASMVECRYDYFLTLSPIPIKSLLSPFKIGESASAYKNIVLTDLEVNERLTAYKVNAIDNFIKKYDANYSLSLFSNKEHNVDWVSMISQGSSTPKILNVSTPSEDSQVNRSFVVKTDRLSLDNFWLKDIWANINIPEYSNSNIILIDNLHVDNVDERDFIEEYTKVTISSSKFFYSTKEGDEFGAIFTKEDGTVLKTYSFKENGSYEIPYIEDFRQSDSNPSGIMFEDGSVNLRVMTYAHGYQSTKYYSDIAEIEVNLRDKRLTYSKNDTINEIQDIYDNTYFTFNSTAVTCEDCSFDVTVTVGEDIVLEKIFLNENDITHEAQASTRKWLKVNEESDLSEFSSKRQVTIMFDAENNLPNEQDNDQTTIPEYLLEISKYREIGDKLQETTPRSAVLTAIGRKNDGQIVRTSYKIVQPGFENPLKDVNIGFENLVNNNAIEDSNSSVNGVLCNQIQFFTTLKIDGFTNDRWATYLEDPQLYIYINIDNDIDNDIDTDESNFNNVHFYSIEDKNKFPNNAVKMKFSWIPNKKTVRCDSSVSYIEENEIEFEKYAYVFGDINDASHLTGEWVYLSNPEFLKNKDTHIPKDIIYRLEDDSSIGGISLEDANKEEKIKIRALAEVANPVPMEFNVKWFVEKIEIHGRVKAEYFKDEDFYNSLEHNPSLVFRKSFIDEDGFSFNPVSTNMKFIVNPVYITACPEDAENISGQKIGVAIMNVGSEDEPKVRIGIQDINQDAKDEFFLQKRYDLAVNRLKESRGNYNYVSDITYYWPKKRYLQDNIQNIYIKPRDFKNDVLSNAITKKSSPFVGMLEDLKSKDSILQNMYNISLLDVDSTLNADYSKSFLMSIFNGYVMNPEYRNEVLCFYYNNNLYLERLYDQWNSVSPLWTEQEATIEVVDSSLLDGKHAWNYEYEVSEDYVKGKSNGGVITKSGNGYLELSTEESIEKYDTGQYNVIGTMGLRETLQESDKLVLPNPIDIDMTLPDGFVNMPNDGEFYRTMLFDMKWIYPHYININNTLMVYPYYFANSYESWLDVSIMEGYMNTRDQDTVDELSRYIASSELFPEEVSRQNYINIKLDKNLYLVKNNYLLFERNSTKTKINMFIPYNVCYDIYPRTMYNTDCKNTINVFMLQQPTIVSDDSRSLNKHYFKVPPFRDDEAEKDYYRTEFEDGKQVIAPVLPPWYFNK